MDSTPNHGNDMGAPGASGSNRRRNRKKQVKRGAAGHAGNNDFATSVHAPYQPIGAQPFHTQHERSTKQHQQPTFTPSVQKLFDSVSNPVNLQITVTGHGRQVNETEFYPAEPTPSTHGPAAKYPQQKPVNSSGQGGYEVDGGIEQSWPSLEDSLMGNTRSQDTGGRYDQNVGPRKRNKRKGKKKGGISQQVEAGTDKVEEADATESVNKQLDGLTLSNNSTGQSKDSCARNTKPQSSGSSRKPSPPSSQTSQEPLVQSEQKPVAQPEQKSVTQTSQKPVAQASQKPVIQPEQKSVVQPEQKPVAQASQKPGAQASQKPVTQAKQKPAVQAASKKSHSSGNGGKASPPLDVIVQADKKPAKVTPGADNQETKDAAMLAELPPPDERTTKAADGASSTVEKKSLPPPVNTFSKYLEAYRSEVGAEYIRELDKDYIRPLAKKSQKFPEAHFYCRLCEYHVDTPELMEKHRLSEDAHLRKKRIKSGDELLRNMPIPTREHMKALCEYLDKVYAEMELSDEEVAARKTAVDKLEKDLHEHSSELQSVTLQICGSVKAGFALKCSNTNIRIITPKTANLAIVMTQIHSVLLSLESTYKDVQSQFTTKEPSISLSIDGVSGTFCMQFLDESYYISNMLLSCYSRWNPKLKQLTILFKYLAKVGGISDVSHGALAAYCFPLMTIFFCQRNRLAPLLCENLDLESKTEAEFQGDIDILTAVPTPKIYTEAIEARSIGELWLNLLSFYSLSSMFKQDMHCVSIINRGLVMKASKAWGSKRLAIEDPALPKRNLCKTVSHQRVFDFISDVIRKSYKYFSVPQLSSGPAFSKIYLPDTQTKKKSQSNGIRAKTADATPTTTKQSAAVAAEEDAVDSTLQKCEVPSDERSSLLSSADADEEAVLLVVDDTRSTVHGSGDTELSESSAVKQLPSTGVASAKQDGDTAGLSTDHKSHSDSSTETQDISAKEGILASSTPVKPEAAVNAATSVAKDEMLYDKESIEKLTADEFCFDFKSKHLALEESKLPIFCRQCSKPNHVTEDCPEEQLPACIPLPPPSEEHRKVLSHLLYDIKEQTELCPDNLKQRNQFVQELTRCIQQVYKKARLNLYGSSCNGFGSVGSDLDICMTLDDTDYLDCNKTRHIINDVAQGLSYIPHLVDILPLIHAKVPIIKFSSIDYQLDADISLYNILAQRNTQMLRRYSQIDERVRPLGYCVKEFAKNCDIGDASKGSLSSYAYVLMLLYYLQQCDPPVLPVLQQLYEGDKSPQVIVEGWNTWFYQGELAKVWQGYGKNDSDVAQLWIGFLDFYSQQFDYKSTVVSIRQQQKMSKFEKLWNSDTLAIEDPFDLKRNLGVALSKKMNAYILSTFIKARAVFNTSPEAILEMPDEERPSIYKFYFHHKDLPSGGGERAPEHSRTCRACGQIGHYAKLCPGKSQKKDRQKQLRDMRQQAKRKAEYENREMERRLSESDSHPDPMRQTPPRSSPMKHQQHRGSPNKQGYNNRSQRGAQPRMQPRQHAHQQQMMLPSQTPVVIPYRMNQNNNAQRHLGFPPMANQFPPPAVPQLNGAAHLPVAGPQPMMVFNNSNLQQPVQGGQPYPSSTVSHR